MIHLQDIEIGYIHGTDHSRVKTEYAYVYRNGILLWQLVVGYLFTNDGFALKTKDDFILKAKDQ